MIEIILRVLCTATIFAAVYLLQTNHVIAAIVAVSTGAAIMLIAVRLTHTGDPS